MKKDSVNSVKLIRAIVRDAVRAWQRHSPLLPHVFDKSLLRGQAIFISSSATVIDIRDEFGLKRPEYQSNQVETVDLTCFLFGFRDAQGAPHKVASRAMRISGNEKAALFNFLKSLLGKAPAYGWDYCSLKGQKCLLTVEHVQKRDGSGVFAAIAALSPLPGGYGGPAPVPEPLAPPPRPQLPPARLVPPLPTVPPTAVSDDVPF
jgi:hypothetical protein